MRTSTPKKQPLQSRLAELEQARQAPGAPTSLAQLREALKDKSSHVVARAALIAGEAEIAGLEEDLAAAFERFMVDPLKTDPGCGAKTAIAEALWRLGSTREGPFLRGIRHVQLEPVFGGKEDTAAPLRAFSALGLVRMLHPDAVLYLADLLADPVLDARLGAVKAIASAGQPGGAPLLRFKARSGDTDARVMHAVFAALLEMAPESSLALVAEFLEMEGEAVAEAAALALGESRLEGAFDILRGWAGRAADPGRRSSALTAIALLRTDRAIDYLLGLVSSGPAEAARDAFAALKVYESDRVLWARVEKAALRFPHLMA